MLRTIGKPQAADPFVGKYHLIDSQGFDEFMIALGINFLQRKLAGTAKPDYDITKNGDYYTLKTVAPLKSSEFTFKFGEEFEQDRINGERVKGIIKLEGNKWVEKQFGSKATIDVVREFNGDKIIATATVKPSADEPPVTMIRTYQKF